MREKLWGGGEGVEKQVRETWGGKRGGLVKKGGFERNRDL